MVLDILRGLSYLHSRRIVHMDLKPGNVFLGVGGVAKIGDFGLSQLMAVVCIHCWVHLSLHLTPQDHVTKNEVIGSLSWAAPEMLLNTRVNEKACDIKIAMQSSRPTVTPQADIFSFGIILHEIVTGEVPIRGQMRSIRYCWASM